MTELEQQLQGRLDKAVEVFKQMKADMAKKDEEIASLNKQLEDATNNVNSELIVQLEEDRTDADKIAGELTAENKKLNEQIGELNLVIQTLKKEKEEATKSINEFKLEIADKDLQINTQTEEYDELLTANKGYKNDLKELADNYMKLHEQDKAISGRILELENKLVEYSNENDKLKNDLTLIDNNYETLQNDFNEKCNQLAKSLNINKEYKTLLDVANEENNNLKENSNKLQEQYEYLRNKDNSEFDKVTELKNRYGKVLYEIKTLIDDIDVQTTYNDVTAGSNKEHPILECTGQKKSEVTYNDIKRTENINELHDANLNI